MATIFIITGIYIHLINIPHNWNSLRIPNKYFIFYNSLTFHVTHRHRTGKLLFHVKKLKSVLRKYV